LSSAALSAAAAAARSGSSKSRRLVGLVGSSKSRRLVGLVIVWFVNATRPWQNGHTSRSVRRRRQQHLRRCCHKGRILSELHQKRGDKGGGRQCVIFVIFVSFFSFVSFVNLRGPDVTLGGFVSAVTPHGHSATLGTRRHRQP
jgi:hypothetical protein